MIAGDGQKAVLYGAGSSVLVDLEETCLRCGIDIVAIVNNYDCASFAIHPEKVMALIELPVGLLELPVMFSLFTPGHRKFAVDQASALGASNFKPLIDPTSILPSSIEVSQGAYINSGAVIGGKSFLGEFSFINRAATLGHHASIGDFASIGPGVSTGGHVAIGRGAVIGTGAVILPGVKIGENSVVGGGAVVTRDVPANCLAVGNPAIVVKQGIAGYNGVGV